MSVGRSSGEAQGVEELRARAESLDEALAALIAAEATIEEELAEEQRWIDELTMELAGEARGGGWEPLRLLGTFVEWLAEGGFVAVIVGLVLLGVVAIFFADCEVDAGDPTPDGLVGVGSVILASPGSAPIGASCLVEVGPAVAQQCPFTIACGAWRYEEQHPCRQGSYEEDTGEGGTTTYYYLIGQSRADAEWKFGFDEHQMLIDMRVDFGGEAGNVTIALHTLEGRGRIK